MDGFDVIFEMLELLEQILEPFGFSETSVEKSLRTILGLLGMFGGGGAA